MPTLHRVLADLKRRKVFQVATVYGATGFVVLQVADLLVEALGVPSLWMKDPVEIRGARAIYRQSLKRWGWIAGPAP